VVPVEQEEERGRLRIRAGETVRAAAVDLTEVGGWFPGPEADVDKLVAILERLSEECSEAAGMLQHSVLREVVTPSVTVDVAPVPEQDRRR
jgi:hypothetical protein